MWLELDYEPEPYPQGPRPAARMTMQDMRDLLDKAPGWNPWKCAEDTTENVHYERAKDF